MACDLIVIGGSLGAANVLEPVLASLPPAFPIPVVLVLHRAREDDGGLLSFLRRASRVPVEEADDKTPLTAGRVHLAPADYHLLVEAGHVSLSVEEPSMSARPAIDLVFETAAYAYASRVVAVVLTGATPDGARGALKIRERGGKVFVQDPSTAEAAALPQAAIDAGASTYVFRPRELPSLLASART